MSDIHDFLLSKGFAGVDPKFDGEFHEFKTNNRKGWLIGSQINKQSGEPIQILNIGDWRTGEKYTYKSNGPYTDYDEKLAQQKILELKRKTDYEKEKRQKDAKEKATYDSKYFSSEGSSKYISKKQINVPGLLFFQGDIVVPCKDIEGEIWGYQRIKEGGEKFFLKGQKIKGTFHIIGNIDDSDTLYLCEGFATGATAYMATRSAVAVAFFASNLLEVGSILREKYRSKRIIILGDDDKYGSSGNAGRTKAESTSQEISAEVVFPKFKDETSHPTDFNDLYLLEGIDEVKKQITPILISIEEETKEKINEYAMPECPGIMKYFVDEIVKRSPRKNECFATSGAIALMSVLCLGRYSFLGMWPSFYILNIGKTSSGKEAPKRFCSEVLKHPLMSEYNLLGLGAHISVPAITTSFPHQRIRLDLLDEYSDFLTLYKSKTNHFARSAAMMLNELWSMNGGYFAGTKAQTRKDETGECWSPGLSLVAMIQNEKFMQIVDEDMLTTGFLSRFLFFSNNDRIKISRDFLEDRASFSDISSVVYEIKRFFPSPSIFSQDISMMESKSLGLLRPKPVELTAQKGVLDLITDISMEFDSKFVDGKDRSSTVFYGKICEHLPKLVTLSAVANQRTEALPDDVDWAWRLLETLNSNSEIIIRQAIAGSDFEKQLERATNFFRTNKKVSKTRFARFFRGDSRTRDLIVRELEDRGVLEESRKHNGGIEYKVTDF